MLGGVRKKQANVSNILVLHAHILRSFQCLTLVSPSLGTTADRVEVEHYDPYNNTWNLTCPALKYVTNFTATACHGKLYVIGSCAVKYNALTMQCYNPVIGKDNNIWLNFINLTVSPWFIIVCLCQIPPVQSRLPVFNSNLVQGKLYWSLG